MRQDVILRRLRLLWNAEIKLETVNQKEGKAGDVKYTETEYLANGEANVYTRMTENTVVRTRHSLTPYKNYVRVAVPENFNGKVVLDPILEKDGEQDVQALMKEGKAYVGIGSFPGSCGETRRRVEKSH